MLQRYLQDERLEFSDTRSTEPVARDEVGRSAFDLQGLSFREAVEAYEKRLIVSALAQHRDHMAQTAASLRMPLRTLYRKIEKYHLLYRRLTKMTMHAMLTNIWFLLSSQ